MSDFLWLLACLSAPLAGFLLGVLLHAASRKHRPARIDGLRLRPGGRLRR